MAMVRIPDELKEKLDQYQDDFKKKTTYDVIEYFIQLAEIQKQTIWELQQEKAQEQERRKREDVHLGEEVKKQLEEFQAHVSLNRPADAIEFLIANYDGGMSVNKIAFDTYVRLRGKT